VFAFVREWRPTHSKKDVADAVAKAHSLSDAVRRLGLRVGGGNRKTLRRLIDHYGIPSDHLDPAWYRGGALEMKATPLDLILVEGSTYSRGHLKRRLYDAGLKQRRCEMCGQDEEWRERRLALILDHVNGIGDDHRLENLRIVCPNCAATLDTHCGRRNRVDPVPRACLHCGKEFIPKYASHRFCSQSCGVHSGSGHEPRPESRKVERPPYEQLMAELAESNWSAVARRYGVSDNAVRKWVRWYEADAERREEA
jgi:hypothetical protein